MSEPPFVLTGPAATLIANGIRTTYPDVRAAQAALRSGDDPIIVGALPFDLAAPAALWTPEKVSHNGELAPERRMPTVRIDAALPAPAEHRNRIRRALQQLTAPDTALRKVVLARALRLVADGPLDAGTLLRRLIAADPSGYGYLVDLAPAGQPGTVLVGVTPELLVERDAGQVRCRPLAGSAPRFADPEADRASGAALAASGKNRHEHQLVIDAMRAVLQPLCTELEIGAQPQLSHTAALWHLSTPITGRLRDTGVTALDLALKLHPTPAVGGVPTAEATELIGALEGDRGFYAGAVGWCDAVGNGRWVVSIRGALLSADRRTALAHSGGGIVAESDADDEVEETTTKFTTILRALGVDQ